MTHNTRTHSRLVFGGLLLSALVAPSCFTTNTSGDDDSTDCPAGEEDCKCKADDKCDTGLTCDSKGHCVASAAAGGSGGSAGSGVGGAGGSAGGVVVTGGTGGDVTGGTGGDTTTGGTGGDTTTGGTGGSSAQGGTDNGGEAGVGNATGEGGAADTGGTGGSAAGKGGSGGSSGKGGSAGKGGSGGSSGKGGSAGKAGSGGSAGSPACTVITGLSSVMHSGTLSGSTIYATIAPNLGQPAMDALIASFYPDPYNGAEIGTITLGQGEEGNYSSCGHCISALEDVDGAETFYFATAGTLVLDSDSLQLDGFPQGTLTGVTLREATYDTSTFVSTLVPGGKCLTVADGSAIVNVAYPAGWDTDVCPLSYNGDGQYCDCGCGAHDPDCSDATLGVCEFCYCNGPDGYCDAPNYINTSNNALCTGPG